MSFATTATSTEGKAGQARLPAAGFFNGFERADVSDEIKLNWAEAEEDGHVLVNAPARKVAVFANTMGEVSMVTECDGRQSVTALDPQEAIRMVALLRDAIDDAIPIHRRNMAEYAAHEAINKAAGGAGQ